MRSKVKAMSRMMKMFKTLREENEMIVKLKGMCPDNRIPRGLLLEGSSAIRDALESFCKAKKWDKINEKRPT
jgi:serine/threonine-protein phosphatase 2B catalytic subunit